VLPRPAKGTIPPISSRQKALPRLSVDPSSVKKGVHVSARKAAIEQQERCGQRLRPHSSTRWEGPSAPLNTQSDRECPDRATGRAAKFSWYGPKKHSHEFQKHHLEHAAQICWATKKGQRLAGARAASCSGPVRSGVGGVECRNSATALVKVHPRDGEQGIAVPSFLSSRNSMSSTQKVAPRL